MEAPDSLVKAGKVCALGASEMYAYQLHNMEIVAEHDGWTPFASMQCHYNLLYHEDERELLPVCRHYNTAITPYSPLASGHLARREWHSNSERWKTDKIMKLNYSAVRRLEINLTSEEVTYLEEPYVARPVTGRIDYFSCSTKLHENPT